MKFLTKIHPLTWFAISLLLIGVYFWLRILQTPAWGDERENYVAGWFMLNNLMPYRDFFFHHAPFPFYVSHWIMLFGGEQPWVFYRIVIMVWWLSNALASIIFVDKRLRVPVAIAWIAYAYSAPMLDMHYFLAENFSLPPIISTLFLLYNTWQNKKANIFPLLAVWVVGSWVAVWSTPVAIPIFGWLFVGILTLAYQRKKELLQQKRHLFYLALVAFFLHLTSLPRQFRYANDWWWGIIEYNQKYYYPFRLAGPDAGDLPYPIFVLLRFFLNLAEQFAHLFAVNLTAARSILGLLRNFIFSPGEWFVVWNAWTEGMLKVETLILVLLLAVLAALILRKKWYPALWLFLLCIALRGRDNEGFKLSAYYIPILALSIIALAENLKKQKAAIFLSSVIGLSLLGWLLLARLEFKNDEGMTTIAYWDPVVEENARSFNRALAPISYKTPGFPDRVLFLGGSADYYYLTGTLPAMKYYYYHPWFHVAPEISGEVRQFLLTNIEYPVILEAEQPFNPELQDLSYAQEFVDILKDRYATISAGVYLPITEKSD